MGAELLSVERYKVFQGLIAFPKLGYVNHEINFISASATVCL